MMIIAGLDLAGSQRRDTGFCVLGSGKEAEAGILHTDGEILHALSKSKPAIVAIDAPLSLPEGRKSIDIRDNRHFRACDLELRKLGIRFFPITLGPMRMLTKRGMGLKRKIRRLLPRSIVIEVYPGATYDIFGIGRKNAKSIRSLFRAFGIVLPRRMLTQDELDGVCCAITGMLYSKKKARGIGNPKEGEIIIPKVKKAWRS